MTVETTTLPEQAAVRQDPGELRALILDSQEPLFARLNQTLFNNFMVELEALVEEGIEGFRPLAGVRTDRMTAILGAIQTANRSHQRMTEWRRGMLLLRERLDNTTVREEAHQLILQFLETLGTSPSGLAEDRKALRRYLDVDAVEERVVRMATAEEHLQEIAILAVGALLSDESQRLTQLKDGAPDRFKVLYDQTNALAFLKGYLVRSAHWRLECAALRALAMLARVLPAAVRDEQLDPDLFQNVYRLSVLAEGNPWTQRMALRVLTHFDLEEALAVFSDRLAAGIARRDNDLFVRKAIADLLGEHPGRGEAFRLLDGILVQGDSSEQVRIAAVRALARFPAIQMTPRIEQVLGLRKETPPDPCAQVRVAALLAILERVEPGNPESDLNRWVLKTCQRCLSLPAHPLFTQALLEHLPLAVAKVIGPGFGISAALHGILQDLDRLVGRPGLSLQLLRVAEETREELIVTRLPEFHLVTTRLGHELGRCCDGDRLDVPVDELAIDPPMLGRIFAYLSRADFGLQVELRPGVRRIQKGDRFSVSLWRILHELAHPQPDKRQAFHHHVGRQFFGQLRAHPFTLAEQSVTKVPGERLFLEAEGQWRRYLPLIDDLFSLTTGLNAPVRVQLFSSQGVTTLTGPRGILGKMRLYLKLTWNYRRYAGLRNEPVSREDLSAPRRYLQTLRSLGVGIGFAPHGYVFEGAYYPLRDPTFEEIFVGTSG